MTTVDRICRIFVKINDPYTPGRLFNNMNLINDIHVTHYMRNSENGLVVFNCFLNDY